VENYLFGWLEGCATKANWNQKCKSTVVTEAIKHFVGRYWIAPGPKAQRLFALYIALRYFGSSPYRGSDKRDVISVEAYNEILDRYREFLFDPLGFFGTGNPNKMIASSVAAYLYTYYYDRTSRFEKFGCFDSNGKQCLGAEFQSFSYGGNNYTFGGGPYNAHQLAKDWLNYRIDGWIVGLRSPKGNREFDSITYHRLFPSAMMILNKLASEPEMITKGKMAGDLTLVDYVMDFSANAQGGAIGRTDYRHLDRTPRFPLRQFFGISTEETEWDIPALYGVNYVPSNLLVSLGSFDEGWRFHKEYNEEVNKPGTGKWNYLTQDYNIGSVVGKNPRQGWNVVVRGRGNAEFIRFFINGDSVAPSDTKETDYQGEAGLQYKNTMYVNLGKTPHYWEFRGDGVNWTEQSTEDGWNFKMMRISSSREVYVAVRLGSNNASVELARKGVDYASYEAFKTAIKTNALLTSNSYVTSTKEVVGKNGSCGLNQPGDCQFPFERMETESSSGKLIEWTNGVMTVQKANQKCSYNFNTWSYSGNCQ